MEGKNYSATISKITKYTDKSKLNVESKTKKVIDDLLVQFNIIDESLNSISLILDKSIDYEVVNKARINVFKELKRKTKLQAAAVRKLGDILCEKYDEDVRNYPIKLLNDRIAEVEAKLAKLTK